MSATIAQRTLTTLKDFYDLMAETQVVRSFMVKAYVDSDTSPVGTTIESLKNALASLEALPATPGASSEVEKELGLGGRKTIMELGYEMGEMKKDILFLEAREEAFLEHLGQLHDNFHETVTDGVNRLKGIPFRVLVTDRDGTTNNYCGRYRSSIQSIYNAVFLTRFARNCCEHPIFITSAPLTNGGILDVSVNPPGSFIYSASKGREFVDLKGERRSFPIEPGKQAVLDAFNQKLTDLLQQPDHEAFSLIGSGLQFKFGQTTVARQDISQSIAPTFSQSFLDAIRAMVEEVDPAGEYLRIEDTGLDIEIILTVEDTGEGLKDFDKAEGVRYLNDALSLNMGKGPHLICGDTHSDVPMVQASMAMTHETYAIFVTRNRELADRLKGVCPNALVVPEPDMLVAILGGLGRLESSCK